MSEPKGRGDAWTEERGTSDEGRRRHDGAPEASEPKGSLEAARRREKNTVLSLAGIAVEYGRRGERVRAVDGVDLTVGRGEIVGLVGESGCGKSTLARAAVGLEPLAAGSVTFEGRDVTPLGRRRRPGYLRGLQMVFQDPYESLNPRRTVGDLIADGVRLGDRAEAGRGETGRGETGRGGGRKDGLRRAGELLERVGLPASAVSSYPHEFSGGQRQRIAIARTLATRPSCLIADEPISALDASAQAQIANLLGDLVDDGDLGLVLVSHDLSVVRQVADRVAVMYLGRIVEIGATEVVWASPQHPYTEALVAAIPHADGAGVLPVDLPGDVPDPANPPSGCRFHPRCPIAQDSCRDLDQRLVPVAGREIACHIRSGSVAAAGQPGH
jgi:oligopeptide/dipeptide ABC transporter ATP-binding protein